MSILILCKFPTLFLLAKLKFLNYDINFPIHGIHFINSSIDWKFGFWNVSLELCNFHAFQNFRRYGKLGLLNISLDCYNSRFNKKLEIWGFWSSLAFTFCQMVRIVIQVWHIKRRSQSMIKLPLFEKKLLYFSVDNKLVSV